MNKLYAALVFAGTLLLSACNGSSGENESSPTPNPVISAVTLTLQDAQGNAQQSFSSDEVITLVASVVDANNAAISGRSVAFSADIGELSVASKLTDSAGQAIVTLSNPTDAAGAGTISATVGEFVATTDYEFITDSLASPSTLTLAMRLDGSLVNQFRADQQVLVSVTMLNNSQPVANEIVTFSADVGSLATTTALTNEQGIASVTLSGNDDLGAGVLIASIANSTTIAPARLNYEVISPDAVIIDDQVRIGYFDGTDFIEGRIKLSVADNTISAGGTLGLTVDLVDGSGERISTPTPVAFSSSCVDSAHATIDETVNSIKGRAESTYEDIDCAGVSGTEDVIFATVTVNGTSNVASETITITGEELGSIEFVSAEPASIVIKGTGGQGKQENSTLTFVVKSALGNPLAQQPVDFILDTEVGGIEITPASGLTNSQGIITTRVNAGTVPTTVRVTAKSSMTIDGEEINVQTQSDLLSINTGLPEQSSMTITAQVLNPESFNINGVTNSITAQLADNFNNPVPDGTTVNFTTEGGQIESSCVTVNGACSVIWTSANPKPSNHRVTVLATASGHETFFESNGNNIFDDEDGSAVVINAVSSGRDRIAPLASGFIDMSEAWRDDNENNVYDAGERFIDFNNDKSFSAPDGLFNGPQCQGDLCAPEGSNEINVRKSLVMIMASSSSCYQLLNANAVNTEYGDNCGYIDYTKSDEVNELVTQSIPSIADGSALGFTLNVSDTAFQSMPQGTSISVSASAGQLDGVTSLTVGNTTATKQVLSFIIANTVGGDPEIGTLTIQITSPSGIVTSYVSQLSLL